MVILLPNKLGGASSILYLDQFYLQVAYEDFDSVISWGTAVLSGSAITSYSPLHVIYWENVFAASDLVIDSSFVDINAPVPSPSLPRFYSASGTALLFGTAFIPSSVSYIASGSVTLSGGSNIVHGSTVVYYPIGGVYSSGLPALPIGSKLPPLPTSPSYYFPPPPTLLGAAITNGPKTITYTNPIITTIGAGSSAQTSSNAVFTIYRGESQNL
jgi:hypothetical protein